MTTTIKSVLISLALSTVSISSQAASVSAAIGSTGQDGFNGRVGLSFDWDKSWFLSETGQLTGYWDAGATHWESGKRASARTTVSFAPVFVYEFSTTSKIKPFIEAGIGASVSSGTQIGDRTLGSVFNFEDRLGAGLKLTDNDRIGLRVIHYSNAGIKQPNNGIESYSVFYSHKL